MAHAPKPHYLVKLHSPLYGPLYGWVRAEKVTPGHEILVHFRSELTDSNDSVWIGLKIISQPDGTNKAEIDPYYEHRYHLY